VYRLFPAVLVVALLSGFEASAADTIRLAVQKTGTLSWELDVIRAHGLEQAHAVTIEVNELASPEAGKIALRGGSADVIVSDWLWVSRERSLGATLAFYPYSSALGAVMARPASSIAALADLKGHTLGVAGGAIDKSWLLLQAAMKQRGLDLARATNVVYGTPALLAQKAIQGELDATLNYWNFCAALEAKGFRRIAGIDDVLPALGVKGRPAFVGYVFDARWAADHADGLARFVAAAHEAQEILARSDAEWERIAGLIGARDPTTLKIYRDRYREGIPRRPIADEVADARTLYHVLAGVGGNALVGPAPDLDRDTFYMTLSGP
jgi:NitT/TauT family transport system substrate-binding protein